MFYTLAVHALRSPFSPSGTLSGLPCEVRYQQSDLGNTVEAKGAQEARTHSGVALDVRRMELHTDRPPQEDTIRYRQVNRAPTFAQALASPGQGMTRDGYSPTGWEISK